VELFDEKPDKLIHAKNEEAAALKKILNQSSPP